MNCVGSEGEWIETTTSSLLNNNYYYSSTKRLSAMSLNSMYRART